MSTLPSVNAPIGQATTNIGAGIARPSLSAGSTAGPALTSGGAIGTSGSLFGALASGIINAGFAVANRAQSVQDYKRLRKDALDDYERERSDYLADLANERAYNSPAAQRARLLQAGINPNTVFGTGSVDNTSSSAMSMNPIEQSKITNGNYFGPLGSQMVDAIAPLMSTSLMQLQAENLKKDQDIKTAQILKLLSETKGIDAATKGQLIQNGWYDALNASTVKERNAAAANYLDNLETNALERMFTQFQLDHMAPAQLANLQASTAKLFADIRSITQSIDYFDSVKNIRQKSEYLNMLRDSVALSLERFEKDAFANTPLKKTDGYHNFMKEVQFFAQSLLGWWAGAGYPMPSSKPRKIGFK